LQKRKVAAKWVPHHLSEEQKAARKKVAEELLWRYEAEGEQFLKRIVATDETWIRDFEPELKSQSSQWKHATSPRPKKCRRQQLKVKLIMIMAYDKNGVIATDKSASGVHCNRGILQKVSQRCSVPKDSPKKVRNVHSRCPHFAL
jgi:histone-lysine N-methyltransferase SETMAR